LLAFSQRNLRYASIVILGGIVAAATLGAIVTSSEPTQISSGSSQQPRASQMINAHRTPTSIADQVRAIAKGAVASTDLDNLVYEGVQFSNYEDDETRSGKMVLMVNYHLAELPTSDDATAKFSATLFQGLFSVDKRVTYVWINFNGPMTDRYGRASETNYVGYALNRSTFGKIEWGNFDVASLCKFLREENSSELDSDGTPKGEDSCSLWPSIRFVDR
jgi:hypothetical protein